MSYVASFIALYLLTGATFDAYDFKVFQRMISNVRCLLITGGDPGLSMWYKASRSSIYNPIDGPAYVLNRNYSYAFLKLFIWPLFPRIFPSWFWLSKRLGFKFLFKLYLIPSTLLLLFYLLAMWALTKYEGVWKAIPILIIFCGVVWWLCRRKDKIMDLTFKR